MAETAKGTRPRGAAKRSGGTAETAKPKAGAAASKPAKAEKGAKAAGVKRAVEIKAAGEAAPIPYSPEEVAEIFRRLAVQRPSPTTELEHTNLYTLLVAVVMSAQMTDTGVNRATRGLFPRAGDPATMVALGEEAIREAIRTITFANAKSRNVFRLSQILLERHGGAVPDTREALEALPGVGRKTANVILNTGFGKDTLAVDTHIFRLGNRLKLAPGKTPEEVEAGFLKIIPEGFLKNAHHWILLHGRYVCKARKPDCGICVIADLCRADEKWNDVPAPLKELPVSGPGLQGVPQDRVAG